MVEVVVAQRMYQRRGTAAEWTAANTVLHAGEIGVELGATPDDTKFKIGTGAHSWSSLPYFGAGGGDVEMRVSGGFIQYSADGGATWEDLIAVDDLKGADGREVQLRVNPADNWLQWRYVGVATWTNLFGLDTLKGDPGDPGPVGPAGPSSSSFPTANFDGGLGDIIVGSFCDLYVPFGFTINKATLLGDAIGILEVDIRVDDYTTYPPDSLDTICGATRPRLLTANRHQDAALTDWTRVIASGSCIRFIVTACTGIKRANLVLEGERS